MAREFAEISYTLVDLVVARYNKNTGAYGTPERVEDGQMFVAEPESDNDKLRGYGVYTEGLSVPIGCKISLSMGGVDFSVLGIIAAITSASSGTTPNQVRTVDTPAGGSGLPYFGVLGVAATEDGGTVIMGHKRVKLDAVPKYTMDGTQNKFNLSEAAGYSFPENGKLHRIKAHETAANWTRPADGTAFAAFFS